MVLSLLRPTGVVSLLIRLAAIAVIAFFILEQVGSGLQMVGSLDPYELVQVRGWL